VKVKSLFTISLLICTIFTGCGGRQTEPIRLVPRNKPVVQVNNTAYYQLFCDGFESLPLQSKQYAYHLYKACVASLDISSDQSAQEVMIDELEKAAGYAPTKALSSLTKLVKYLLTGDGKIL